MNAQGFINMDEYGFEVEDPNQLAMSNSDIYLMFGNAGIGNQGLVLIPTADGGQLQNFHEELITI